MNFHYPGTSQPTSATAMTGPSYGYSMLPPVQHSLPASPEMSYNPYNSSVAPTVSSLPIMTPVNPLPDNPFGNPLNNSFGVRPSTEPVIKVGFASGNTLSALIKFLKSMHPYACFRFSRSEINFCQFTQDGQIVNAFRTSVHDLEENFYNVDVEEFSFYFSFEDLHKAIGKAVADSVVRLHLYYEGPDRCYLRVFNVSKKDTSPAKLYTDVSQSMTSNCKITTLPEEHWKSNVHIRINPESLSRYATQVKNAHATQVDIQACEHVFECAAIATQKNGHVNASQKPNHIRFVDGAPSANNCATCTRHQLSISSGRFETFVGFNQMPTKKGSVTIRYRYTPMYISLEIDVGNSTKLVCCIMPPQSIQLSG